ncbi:putative lipoprotein [Sinobacterium caligoides]|uniref:Putative lipoprotein n=1 Tax=Sinobacterium caligoides TaxID=933926 RepID=A0A3N2DL74_9GAMM|nr:META domain-containing protein [Sinobacterium caligoides]ROS00105.1 putative lipoprotein [Sinobacterium caligoides]
MLRKSLMAAYLIAGAVFLTACDSRSVDKADEPDMKKITTEIMYRERMALPPGAELTVSFANVAKMDVAEELVAKTTVTELGMPPYEVELPYDANKIDPKGRYSARAVIKLNDRLIYTTDTSNDVFASDENGKVQLMLKRVGGGHEAAHKSAAKQVSSNASLTNTYWKLMTLNGESVDVGAGDKEVYLQLMSENKAIRGFSGCNRYMGEYRIGSDGLKFGPIGSTMKACMKGMELEQSYLKALEDMHSVVVRGETLTMKNHAGDVVASFESRYMQ